MQTADNKEIIQFLRPDFNDFGKNFFRVVKEPKAVGNCTKMLHRCQDIS
jgi:hypothetical protein